MRSKRGVNYLFTLLPVLTLLFLAAACTTFNATLTPSPTQEGTYQVDNSFLEFYRTLGGRTVLGPAITPLFQRDNLRAQYTSNALMIYDLRAPAYQRYQLFPLGLHIGVSDPPVSPPAEEVTDRYVEGHLIYSEFYQTYRELDGIRYVGRPLTEVRYNPEKRRLEQYFENLGFYRKDGDPPGKVHLLAYGAFVCDSYCRYQALQDSIPARQGSVPEPFASAVSRLGPAFVGRPISDPYLAPDGHAELIFDNLVLYADPQGSGRVFARPISEKLGYPAQPLLPRMDDPRMVFFPIEGDWGHNIPLVFSDYLAQHGSLDIAGQPITELFVLKPGVFRQCFTNLCLDYHASAPANLHIRPAPLGMVYKAEFYQNVVVQDFTASQSPHELTMKLWERKPILTSDEGQTIYVAIFEDQVPLQNLEPILKVTLQDGRQVTHRFPPTNKSGQTSFSLPAVVAENGSLIPYQVCLSSLSGSVVCVRESYIIWGNP